MSTRAALLAYSFILAGCSGADQGADHRPLWQQVRLGEVWALMDQVGWSGWASYGRQLEREGRIQPREMPSGWQGGADLAAGRVYLAPEVWERMPIEHLAVVLLDEMAHLRYQTAGHEEFDRLHGEWVAAIARAGGRHDATIQS